ncbi:ATP-binding protein [Aureimonas phyllosphaerae]|uniref:histidine kinase n=1 Tax=Aureimonas phyllosphaerae TaxID=1166078 RepID=A0A7W6BLC6_9HYPH|nr:ATP-binding protein [Aureimonas phyllosphaerae]MBB3934133.1 signal transduction histidine kinase [Aureimonas phyllosphaerae]MBB3958651.1 signal transduction histidine kinase [Aureimonas phyllosphaerae]SFF00192.1 Signal transduction histidine kinase [Aureimonas phyllosphaerae]
MMSWWHKTLSGQLVAALLGALLLSQAVSFLFVWQERKQVLEAGDRAEFTNRTQSLARLVASLPADVRERIARASATDGTRFWIAPATEPGSPVWLGEMRAQFATPLARLLEASEGVALAEGREPGEAASALASAEVADEQSPPANWPANLPTGARALAFSDDLGVGFSVPLGDGTTFNAAYYNHFTGSILSTPFPMTFALTAGLVALVAIVVIRRIAEPLARLTQAAETLGRGEVLEPLPETGPDDIRHTAEAFNRMQERLHRFVQDRTRMLGAIGHDLRTPLTTLRLRAEFVEDEELQARMFATIEEMRAMTEAILALARQESETEPTRTVDLGTLVESLCEDLAEVGNDVRFEEGGRITCRCRPDSLRRALRNLIENAVRYGREANVSLTSAADGVEIRVRDRGPGIPADRLEDVFAPFVRLEESRNTETGGVGLGLSIARAIARQHGGDVLLRSGGRGLEAAIRLPR